MKEIEKILKTVSDGLRLAAQGITSLSEKVDEAARSMGTAETTGKKEGASAKAKTRARKTVPAGKAIRKKNAAAAQSMTAIDAVYEIVKKSDAPVDNATLRQKTGFESKKIANVLFKLKQQGKIKSVGKGVYTAA